MFVRLFCGTKNAKNSWISTIGSWMLSTVNIQLEVEAAVKQNKQTWGHQAEREVAEWLSTPFSGHWCRLHLVSPCLSLVSAFGWEGPMVRMTSWHQNHQRVVWKCWPLLKDLDPRGCSTGLCRCAVTLVSNHCCYKPSSAWVVVWVSQGSSKSWKDVGKVCQILSSWLEDIVYLCLFVM